MRGSCRVLSSGKPGLETSTKKGSNGTVNHCRTKIDYSEMLFFDNERWNITVRRVGPVCILPV
jgi:hypothetical protein